MCKIFSTRKSSKYVYIHLEDEDRDLWGARKIRIADFNYAKKFHNPDFLAVISLDTYDRDEADSMTAVRFVDPDVTYTKPYWL